MDIVPLLACLLPTLSATTVRQFSHIIVALLTLTGRVTMRGLARWTGPGGSYRTVQRFFATVIPWASVFWLFFRHHLYDSTEVYILAGDEVTIEMTPYDLTKGRINFHHNDVRPGGGGPPPPQRPGGPGNFRRR